MSHYGTIPAIPPDQLKSQYISRARERLRLGLGTRRPWRELFEYRSFDVPATFGAAITRVTVNVNYFRMNYAIFMLLILFLSHLWRPISLIVFTVVMAAWLFLYFLRDEPLLLFRRVVDDRAVLIVLWIVTIVLLLLTRATVNVLAAVGASAAVVVVHAAFRKTEDLFLDEEAVETEGLLSSGAGNGVATVPSPPYSPPSPQ